MDVMSSGLIEYATSGYTIAGELISGDSHVVLSRSAGILAAVIDGLGHGPEAAAAAAAAVETLTYHSADKTLESLILLCHVALSKTRGAAMIIAELSPAAGTVTTLCVGEVQGCLISRNAVDPRNAVQQPLLCPGLVGKSLPALHTTTFTVARGDVLILATDGIAPDYHRNVRVEDGIDEIAERVVKNDCKMNDDALVLAVRYLG